MLIPCRNDYNLCVYSTFSIVYELYFLMGFNIFLFICNSQ